MPSSIKFFCFLHLIFFIFQEGSEKKIPKQNKVYEHIKKEIDIRAKRGVGKPVGGYQAGITKIREKKIKIMMDWANDPFCKGLFVDASRNAAVTGGDRDLKSDVQDKKRREKYFLIKHNLHTCIL